MPDSDKDKEHKPSGHVLHDKGGRAVWQWAIDSGKTVIDSTSRLMKKLDISHLRLLEDEEREALGPADEEQSSGEPPGKSPTRGGAPAGNSADMNRGFNPYDSRAPAARGPAQAGQKSSPAQRAALPAGPAEKKRPGFLARLFGRGR